jgi:lipoyl(octanoyl) transferase
MQFWSLAGVTGYEEARQLQLKLVEARARDLIPDTVLFLEHRPVITRGRGLQLTGEERPRHMPVGALPKDVEFAESERGGDLTYHGPGQLVIYPICKLDGQGFGPKHDIGGFIRKLEQVLIDELAARSIHADSKRGATGVWVGARKIASIGIAVKRWVTYHGAAINCVNNLAPFMLISPCGFSPDVMTSLRHLQPLGAYWREELETALSARMAAVGRDAKVVRMSVAQASALVPAVAAAAIAAPPSVTESSPRDAQV